MAVGPQESTLAPTFSRIVAVAVVAICVLTEVSLVAYGHLDALLRATPAVALVGFGAYILFWAPLVRVRPSDIEIVNPLRTVHVAWWAVRDIRTQWTLTVVTDNGRVSAWAAPAPSPWNSVGRLRRDALGRPSLGAERGDGPRGSQSAAPIVVQQWERYRDASAGDTPAVVTRWHRATIGVLSVLVVLTIAGLAWP